MHALEHNKNDDAKGKQWLANAAVQRAARHTVQIQYWESGIPAAQGSGVLLEVGNSLFLVSAYHVFQRATGLGPLRATGGLGVTDEIDLRKRKVIAAPAPHDICVVELSRSDMSAWKKLRPVHLGDLGVRDDQHPDNWYVMFGFPERAFSVQPDAKLVNSQGYQFASHAATKQAVLDRLDRNIQVSIEWYPDANEGDWYPNQFVAPYGMSGCGMWRVPRYNVLDSQTEVRPDLIGIATEAWEADEVLVGTRIDHVVGIIRQHYPLLRPAIDLILPQSMCAR